MKKVRKLLAFVLALTMAVTVPAAWMGVFADETPASNVIAEFDGTGLTVGSDDNASFANCQAITNASFEVKNVYDKSPSTYVNKMYAVDRYNGRDGSILKVYQDNYKGPANYNNNMPYINKSMSDYKEETFTAEAYVLPDGKSTVQITIVDTTVKPKVEIAVTIDPSNGLFIGSGKSKVAIGTIGNGNWAKIAISYNVSQNEEGNTVKSYSVYLNDVLKGTKALDASYVPSEARFIQVFPAGSEASPSTTAVYWDDLKIYKGTPQETYVNLDFEKMQTLQCDGMGGTPAGGTLEAGKYGNSGKQLEIKNSAPVNWLVSSASTKITGDFVFETSFLLQDGATAFHGFRKSDSSSKKAECALFELKNGNIYVGKARTQVSGFSYENNRWYQMTAVYHSATETCDLYINGILVQKGFSTGIPPEGYSIERMNIYYTGNTESCLAYRYIKIYKGSSFDTTGYTAGVTAKSESDNTTVNNGEIITNRTTKTELMNDLDKSGNDVNVYVYSVADNGVYTKTDSVENGNILIAVSGNGKTFVYYPIGYDKTYFDVNFDRQEIPNILKQSDTINNGKVTKSFETGYRSNVTYALKLNAGGTSRTDAYYDFTKNVTGDFVLEGTVATTGYFLVSAYDASYDVSKDVHELIRISKPYIQCNGRSVNNLYYSPTEWIKFTVVYKADTDKYELYVNGTKVLEDITAGIKEKITKIRIYTAFETGKGTTYIDNLKFMKKSYDPNSDVASITANGTGKVYVYGDRIYTNSAGTLATDATVNGVSDSLENHKNGDKIVLKKGSTIKEYIIENIPSYPIVNNLAVYQIDNVIKSEADIYSFDSARQYTMILASYDTNGTLKEVTTARNAAGSNSITAELAKEDTKTYKAFLFNSIGDLVPLCSSVTYKK